MSSSIHLTNRLHNFLTRMSLGHLLLGWVGLYILLVMLFAGLYAMLATMGCGQVQSPAGQTKNFADLLYFSTITMGTVGYGDLSPVGWARLIASIQVGLGFICTGLGIALLSFAMLRPRPSIVFADRMVFDCARDLLTTRVVNLSAGTLVAVEAEMWLREQTRAEEDGKLQTSHFTLDVTMPTVLRMLPKDMWLFHHHTANPGRRGTQEVPFRREDLRPNRSVAILIRAFDENTQTQVIGYRVYTAKEITCGRFLGTGPSEKKGRLANLSRFSQITAPDDSDCTNCGLPIASCPYRTCDQ